MKIHEIIYSKLANLYVGEPKRYLKEVRRVIAPEIPAIVDSFYKEVQEVAELAPLLQNAMVERNLHASLATWLADLLAPQTDLKALIARQIEVGAKHADINVNLHYIHHGLRILKREVHSRLEANVREREKLVNCLYVTDELFDILSSLMSDSYFESLVKHETSALSLRMQAMSRNVALECERLCVLLLQWNREALNFLFQEGKPAPENAPLLGFSEFGMWLEHKGEFVLPNPELAENLKNQMREIDIDFSQAVLHADGNRKKFRAFIKSLNERVNQTAWQIEAVVDQVQKIESGRDSLTHLYNRRFLDTVLRRETEISFRQGFPFAVLLVDLDHFKRVNDQYGHDGGDAVLTQMAEILTTSVRASDFVFRYGGEEFLVILGNVTAEEAGRVGEKIRAVCQGREFALPGGRRIAVTVSIGFALYDGHPDYQRLVKRADQALYRAKEQGRNRVVEG